MIITPALVAVWLVGGVVSAAGGWLFHKVVRDKIAKLEARVNSLEGKK